MINFNNVTLSRVKTIFVYSPHTTQEDRENREREEMGNTAPVVDKEADHPIHRIVGTETIPVHSRYWEDAFEDVEYIWAGYSTEAMQVVLHEFCTQFSKYGMKGMKIRFWSFVRKRRCLS
jgi:hypothetical protein